MIVTGLDLEPANTAPMKLEKDFNYLSKMVTIPWDPWKKNLKILSHKKIESNWNIAQGSFQILGLFARKPQPEKRTRFWKKNKVAQKMLKEKKNEAQEMLRKELWGASEADKQTVERKQKEEEDVPKLEKKPILKKMEAYES